MSELWPFMTIAGFMLGLVTGVVAVTYGFRLGFRASYELRNPDDDEDRNRGLFAEGTEPAEFALLEEQEKQKQ